MLKTSEIIYENSGVITVGKKLNVIHFNDVYNIESSTIEPVAGAARFVTAVEALLDQHEDNSSTIVLFSGDAISPSSRKLDPSDSLVKYWTYFHLFLISKHAGQGQTDD
jgi:hypothetical protein